MKGIFLFYAFLLYTGITVSQTISGVIEDASTGEKLFGAAVLEKGSSNGVTTDFNGNFSIKLTNGLPATLTITYVGFEKQEINVTNLEKIKLKMKGENVTLESVSVIDDRITEKQRESAVTVESMDAIAVKETPAVNFYDGLGHLKGVDLTAASMGFKVINTRGFNSTRPVRSLQIIDGVDNQAPGLNFSVGNFAGASELDIQRVELIVGANSGLYGPNAFNGVISMTTKDPFVHQGLDVMGKVGERNLRETSLRFARAHKLFGSQSEVIAYKINFSYMQAYDWVADNYDPTDQSIAEANNPGGYDAVNRYGDENRPNQNDETGDYGQLNSPGLGIYHRTGYNEVDLVDYDTKNLKVSPSLHFKLPAKLDAKLTYNYGTGTTVYQGDNRYSLKDLKMEQYIAEIGNKDKFFIRAYHTAEDAGKSYDAVFTAFLLQSDAKSSSDWSKDYLAYWQKYNVNKVRALPGYPDPRDREWTQQWFGDSKEATQALAQLIMAENIDSLYAYHNSARKYADGRGFSQFNRPRYKEGTAEFDSAFNSITSKQTYSEGGSGFFDKSSLSHIQAQIWFNEDELHVNGLKWLLGGNLRAYNPNSNGTIFSDTNGRRISNKEYGIYTSIEKRIVNNSIILTATGRVDKNENFDYAYSPAFSVVYVPNEKHTFRTSFSSAIRNPTLQDQYLFYNVGRAVLIGNLNGYDDLITVESFFDAYDSSTFRPRLLDTFSVAPVRPEKVKSVEIGYKGMISKQLFIDASYYFSWYNDFLGYVIGADVQSINNGADARIDEIYRVTANSTTQVTTQGFSIGINYYFKKYFALSGNYSWNILNKDSIDDPIIPAYNTPENKFNVGISGRDIHLVMFNKTLHGFGFNVNYKWIEGFLFEGSPQFTGSIPTYDILDAQISYRANRIHTTFKLGASNILNKLSYQTYGGPRVGRMAYFSILFELSKK